ncbi:MAG: hypothetical protein GY842_03355 [bacterium]|nr:hypothetical protein [bacterium]
MERLRKSINLVLGVGVLALASGGSAVLLASRPKPAVTAMERWVPRVSVEAIAPVVFDAPIVGYGTVRPKRQVKIVPEVGGRLVGVHEDLAVGKVIRKGELLFEIDARVYEARVRQGEAEVRRLEAELRRHQKDQVNLERRLMLAKRQLELARTDFEREGKLTEQDAGNDPDLEGAEGHYLRQQDAVLAYESQLDLIPVNIEETSALLDTKRAQLDEAKLNVEKTRIVCPFDARVDSVTAQESQVVIASLQIATLTDMEALEIPVVIDPGELRWTDEKAFAHAVGQDRGDAPEARITWTLRGQEFSWTGRITRLERMDEVTRTAHVVVEIRDIMSSLEVGKGNSRPPLSVGMFCRAELPTEPLNDALIVPRHAVYDESTVYVFEADEGDSHDGRLAIRRVSILRSVGDSVLVAYGRAEGMGATEADEAASQMTELAAGDLVVVSPLHKAVEGMRLVRRAGDDRLAVTWPASTLPEGVDAADAAGAWLLGSVAGAR